MNSSILIRNLTEEENKRLEQIQRKFGIKTNSEAVRMLLKYTVVLDDELQTFYESYEAVAKIAYSLKWFCDKAGLYHESAHAENVVKLCLNRQMQYKYLIDKRNKVKS